MVAGGGPAGFTLIESLVALLLLSVGLLGLAMLFPLGLRLGSQGQVNSAATQVAQREMEQIRENIFSPSGSFTDVDGNTLDASCSGVPGTGCGNPLTANGMVDYSLPPAVGYSGGVHDSAGQLYSVRWNVTVTVNDGRKIILESEPVNPTAGLPIPVHLETLVAR